MAKRTGEDVSPLYHLSERICSINDIQLIGENRNTYCVSNRLFAYETRNKNIKFVIDLHKSKQTGDDAAVPIAHWKTIELNTILGKTKAFNLFIRPNATTHDTIAFLNENKSITVVSLPYLSEAESVGNTAESKTCAFERILEPVSRTIPGFKVDFYRWNPVSAKILIVTDEAKLIVWDLAVNSYYLVPFQSEPQEELGTDIVDAEWNHTGAYFTVTFDNGTTVLFDQNVTALGLVSEKRTEEKVLLLDHEKRSDRSKGDLFYIFTCGRKNKKNAETDFKYGIITLKIKPLETSCKRGDYLKLNDRNFLVTSPKTRPFAFYESINGILFFGKKYLKNIYCFDYSKSNHSIQCTQIISLERDIYQICMAPITLLKKDSNEIAKFIVTNTLNHVAHTLESITVYGARPGVEPIKGSFKALENEKTFSQKFYSKLSKKKVYETPDKTIAILSNRFMGELKLTKNPSAISFTDEKLAEAAKKYPLKKETVIAQAFENAPKFPGFEALIKNNPKLKKYFESFLTSLPPADKVKTGLEWLNIVKGVYDLFA